jgi:hypothetical protein
MMNGTNQVLGMVEAGTFRRLAPPTAENRPSRLTRIFPQAAQPPESGELDLSEHEGRAIMVTGHDQGAWVFSAEVKDQAGLILTEVVKKVFGKASKEY